MTTKGGNQLISSVYSNLMLVMGLFQAAIQHPILRQLLSTVAERLVPMLCVAGSITTRNKYLYGPVVVGLGFCVLNV